MFQSPMQSIRGPLFSNNHFFLELIEFAQSHQFLPTMLIESSADSNAIENYATDSLWLREDMRLFGVSVLSLLPHWTVVVISIALFNSDVQ